ncbi:MAG: DEAD/DEAH box helicase [Desulfurococcaceae archaeon]
MEIGKIANCLQELGYRKLTDIQKKALMEALREDKSMIIVAPTGSGKTEAAVFPVMLKIKARNVNPIAAIYITPLRALNRDIERRLNTIATCFGINVGVRHGDTPLSIRKNITRSPPHILITTPESFNYIIINEDIRHYLKNLEFIIIDEFRDLIESKRGLLFFTTLFFLEKVLGKRFFKVALTATMHDDAIARKILSLDEQGDIELIRDPSLRKIEITVDIPVCRSDLCRDLNNIIKNEDLAARVEEILNKIIQYKYFFVSL